MLQTTNQIFYDYVKLPEGRLRVDHMIRSNHGFNGNSMATTINFNGLVQRQHLLRCSNRLPELLEAPKHQESFTLQKKNVSLLKSIGIVITIVAILLLWI